MDRCNDDSRREYLLDTGVFRSLTQDQMEYLLEHRHSIHLTASIVVPFELLSGIPELGNPSAPKEFRLRRAALLKYRKLVGTEHTYWDEPSVIKAKAFGVRMSARMPSSFLILVKACAECESLPEVEAVVARAQSLSNTMPSLDWLRSQSEAVSDHFRRALGEGVRLVKAAVASQLPIPDAESSGTRRKLARGFVPYLLDVGDLRRYVFLVLAEQAGTWNGEIPDTAPFEACVKIAEALGERYDGSLDLYIDAFATYWVEKSRTGGESHRNDPFDLDHIAYLRPGDQNQVLVTSDRKLARRCLEVAPGRAMALREFLSAVI